MKNSEMKQAVAQGILDALTHRTTILAARARLDGVEFSNFKDSLPGLKNLYDLIAAAIDESFPE